MTTHSDTDVSAAPWNADAAYLYTLDLDGPALAWECLRRYPGYRAEWQRGRLLRSRAAVPRWGLRCCR